MLSTLEPTRKYFFTIFALSSVLLVVFTLLIYDQFKNAEQRNDSVRYTYHIIQQIKNIQADALNMQTHQRGYLLTGHKAFLGNYNDSHKRILEEIQRIGDATQDNPRQQENIKELQKAITTLINTLRTHINHYDNSIFRVPKEDIMRSKAALDKVAAVVDAFSQEEYNLLETRVKAVRKQQQRYRYTLFIGATFALGSLLIANAIIYKLLGRNKQSAEDLRASEERFQLVISGINDGIYDYNVADGSVYYSPSCKAMLGYDDTGHPMSLAVFESLIHPEDLDKSKELFNRYLAGEIPHYQNYFRARHRDGSWRWIMSRGVGIRNARGEIIRVVGAHTDVTEHKRREAELEQLNSDLEGFTYIASHDLRAPLVNIRGFASEVENSLEEVSSIITPVADSLDDSNAERLNKALTKDLPESLNFIKVSVERMDKLTTAITDMSRIGRHEYSTSPVDCDEIVSRCLSALGHEINTKNIIIERGPLPVIYSDPLAVEQIFGNLLDNAVKYLDGTRQGHISIEARTYLDEVIFSITDNGRGIAESDYRKVFEVFRRAGNSGNVRGSGMGMAYVAATLRQLGGRIWLSSKLHEGTSFYFTLPLRARIEMQEAA